MQSFVYAEYISAALASVWKNHAKLPRTEDMWHEYNKRVRDQGGFSKYFLFLGSSKADGGSYSVNLQGAKFTMCVALWCRYDEVLRIVGE